MPRCAVTGHLCAQSSIAAYAELPTPGDPSLRERYKLRLCTRHGHQLLVLLLKRGSNLLAEQELPEFCLGCAQPTDGLVYEARWFEGDWSVSAAFALCADCAASPLEALVEGPVTAEKMPPRERPTRKGSRR